MKTFDDIANILSLVKYDEPGWEIRLRKDGFRPYLQVYCTSGICNVTGNRLEWSGRKWMLSYHMCKSEVVRTAYKAIHAAVLHEMNEKFTYKDVCIFDPHLDVDALAEFRQNVPLDTRDESHHGT